MMASKIYGAILERFKLSKKSFMQMALHILMLSAMLLFFKLNIVTIIIWMWLNTFLQLYVTNPTLSIFYALTNRDKEDNVLKPKLFVIKSFFLYWADVQERYYTFGCCRDTIFNFIFLQQSRSKYKERREGKIL